MVLAALFLHLMKKVRVPNLIEPDACHRVVLLVECCRPCQRKKDRPANGPSAAGGTNSVLTKSFAEDARMTVLKLLTVKHRIDDKSRKSTILFTKRKKKAPLLSGFEAHPYPQPRSSLSSQIFKAHGSSPGFRQRLDNGKPQTGTGGSVSSAAIKRLKYPRSLFLRYAGAGIRYRQ